MKTFREFILIAEDKMGERLGNMSDADFDQFLKGRTPGESQTYREKRVKFKKTNVSSKDAGFGGQSNNQNSQRSQTPPRSTQQPPTGGSGGAKPPSNPSSRPSSTNTPPRLAEPVKGPGLRSRLGGIAGPALNVAGAAMDYKARRDAGQSRARAAGGTASSLAGYAAAARLGAMVPGPPIVKGVAAIGAGIVGADKAQKAYDWAADKTRPQRQAISKATGYDNAQQTNALIKPGSGLSGIQRAQQTANTRDARQVAANVGSYGTRQGSALTGIGKNTSFDKNAGTITSQGKTAKLASTQLIRDPNSGKQVVGDLAYRGGKATYLARPSIQSRDTSLSANIGRALNIGRFSKSAEQQASKNEYRTALKNTQTYQKQLGIAPQAATTQKLPGRGVGSEVGPKLVGPKIVGPAKVGPTKPQSPSKTLIKPV